MDGEEKDFRDMYAGLAMAAELISSGADDAPAEALARAAAEAGRTIVQQIAFNAFELADAMAEERRRRG